MTTLQTVRDEPTGLSAIVAKRVRVFLAEHQIKQIQVANAMGMSRAAFNKRVTGQQAMDLDEIEALANTLGVDPGVFLSGEPPPSPGGPGGGASGQPASAAGRSNCRSSRVCDRPLISVLGVAA